MAGVEDARTQRAGVTEQILEARRLQRLSGVDPDTRRAEIAQVAKKFGWGPVGADADALLAQKLKDLRVTADGFGPARDAKGLIELRGERAAVPNLARQKIPGTVSLADFTLEAEPRGRGATGAVYFGTHTATGMPVAIKEMWYPDQAAMEVRVLQALPAESAHVPALKAHFVENGKGYLVMSQGGAPLGMSVTTTHAAITEALGILDGLAALHDAGFVHRDIKPDNVLSTGKPSSSMLIDFSNASAIDTPSGASAPANGGIAGFVPPEQLTGKPGHPRSGDVFAAATVLVGRLTGESPFYSDHPVNGADAWDAIYRRGPRLDGVVGPELAAVLRKALSYDAKDRFQSAPEFAAALRPFLTRPEPSMASVVRRFPDGTLVKEASSPAIYVLFGGAKFHATDPSFFEATDRSGQRIRTVPEGALAGLGSVPADGTLVREAGHPDVFRIEGGQKRPVSAEGLSWADVRVVPSGSLKGEAASNEGAGHRILNAQYATHGGQADVTQRLGARLTWESRVRADNETMGGDPDVGTRKMLRIAAADDQGRAKVFEFPEGSDVEGRLFRRFATRGTLTLSAQYGTAEHHVDVSQRVLELAQSGAAAEASNGLGGDPHYGVRKSLRIFFLSHDGQEHSVEYGEGSAVPLAQLVAQFASPGR